MAGQGQQPLSAGAGGAGGVPSHSLGHLGATAGCAVQRPPAAVGQVPGAGHPAAVRQQVGGLFCFDLSGLQGALMCDL